MTTKWQISSADKFFQVSSFLYKSESTKQNYDDVTDFSTNLGGHAGYGRHIISSDDKHLTVVVKMKSHQPRV